VRLLACMAQACVGHQSTVAAMCGGGEGGDGAGRGGVHTQHCSSQPPACCPFTVQEFTTHQAEEESQILPAVAAVLSEVIVSCGLPFEGPPICVVFDACTSADRSPPTLLVPHPSPTGRVNSAGQPVEGRQADGAAAAADPGRAGCGRRRGGWGGRCERHRHWRGGWAWHCHHGRGGGWKGGAA
jgi:hypothetical protein